MTEIRNKVEEAGIISFDFRDLIPQGQRSVIDIKDFLFDGVMVKEKDFRQKVLSHDWEQYRDHYVGITCSVDAILPLWVFMLLASHLESEAALVIRGNAAHLEGALLRRSLENLNPELYRDKIVLVKGCGAEVPESAYITLTLLLQPVVKTLMFGEACSTVPVYKRK